MVETVEGLRGRARSLIQGFEVAGMRDDVVVDVLPVVYAIEQEFAALRLDLVRAVVGRGIPRRHGSTRASVWLAGKLRISFKAAAAMVRLAEAFAETAPATGQALAVGAVNEEQASAIVAAVRHLPVGDRARGEAFLVSVADVLAPADLKTIGSHLHEVIDPVGAEAARRERFEDQERKDADRGITISQVDGDSVWQIRGRMNAETAAVINAAIDPLCSPRRHRSVLDPTVPVDGHARGTSVGDSGDPAGSGESRVEVGSGGGGVSGRFGTGSADRGADDGDADDRGADDGGADNRGADDGGLAGGGTAGGGTAGGGTAGGGPAGPAGPGDVGAGSGDGRAPGGPEVVGDEREPVADLRTAAARRLDALKEVCSLALSSGRLPDNGGDRPQLTVTVRWETLRDQVGAAVLDDGSELSPGDIRRIACDCAVLPMVLGGASVPLDVGRERRFITGPLRRALEVRDRGCCFPGCGRPKQWTSGHHVRHWADGGATSLANACLLCDRHHRVVHAGEWQVRMNPLDGLPEFIPPVYVDAARRPRRNVRHQFARC